MTHITKSEISTHRKPSHKTQGKTIYFLDQWNLKMTKIN